MDGKGRAIAAAARGLVGVRFRPQGRDPALGLDCVGLVLAALERAGAARIGATQDYPQRGGNPERVIRLIDATGLARARSDQGGAGSVVLMQVGPAQLHLAVLTATGFVHADAGLRRVVEVPGRPGWCVLGAWHADMGEN